MVEEKELVINPTLKQQLAWDALFNDSILRVFFGGGAGGGKSWLGCEWLMVVAYFFPRMKAFIARKELKRLMASTYLTFLKVLNHHGIYEDWKLNGQYNFIESKSTGSRIDLIDLDFQPSDPQFDRFGSLEYSVGWIEESGESDFMAFDVLKSRVGRNPVLNAEGKKLGSKLLLTFNPTKNWLYSNIYKVWKEGNLPDNYAFIQSLYKDNPHTFDTYGVNLADIKDKATKERLMYGNWEYDDDPTGLINYDATVDLFTNSVDSGHLYLTADIARHGKDKTVIMLWNGLKVIDIQTYEKQGVDETARIIRDLAFNHKIPYSRIIADEDGIGGGVVDILRGIKGFIANSAPLTDPLDNLLLDDSLVNKENYKNLKVQCSYKLADMVNTRAMAIEGCDDEKIKNFIIEELEQIKSKNPDRDAKRMIISKDEIKERIGRSPDYADCLMMRMFFLFHERFYPHIAERSEMAKKVSEYFRRNISRHNLNSTK